MSERTFTPITGAPVIFDVEQGTPEWHTARRGRLTASTIGKLLTPTLKVADNDTSRGLIATLAAERITGRTEETRMTDDMFRGVLAEPIARETYSGLYQQAVEVGFMLRIEDDWTLGASPDGLVGMDGGLEIKAPRAKGHIQTVLADEVPAFYMPQIQACLLVSGRAWWDFVSFHGGLPLYVKRVTPDPDWFEAIVAAAQRAEEDIQAIVYDFERRTKGLPKTDRLDLEIRVA